MNPDFLPQGPGKAERDLRVGNSQPHGGRTRYILPRLSQNQIRPPVLHYPFHPLHQWKSVLPRKPHFFSRHGRIAAGQERMAGRADHSLLGWVAYYQRLATTPPDLVEERH
ncbi:MAG: hypothetical protein ACRDOI_16540 [Trebonia sp.]